VQRLLEVQFSPHGGRRHLGDLVLAAGVRGEELDDLVLDERGVHVHDDEALGPPVQPRRDHRDIDAQGRRLGHQGGPQRLRLRTGHGELDGRHGVLGQPEDTVDVAAGPGDPGGDRGRRLSGERMPEHGHQRPAVPARPVVAETGDDLGLQPHRVRPAVHRGPQVALQTGRRMRHERAQHYPATGDDLLDVDHVDRVGGEGVEEPGRDSGPVLAEDFDEESGDIRRL
jgi:hypothetical protein